MHLLQYFYYTEGFVPVKVKNLPFFIFTCGQHLPRIDQVTVIGERFCSSRFRFHNGFLLVFFMFRFLMYATILSVVALFRKLRFVTQFFSISTTYKILIDVYSIYRLIGFLLLFRQFLIFASIRLLQNRKCYLQTCVRQFQ